MWQSYCVWYVKDTNLKANHNKTLITWVLRVLCLICQRYKFKSKSQLRIDSVTQSMYCVWYVKDTNLKANHNSFIVRYFRFWLCLICQRYKFKSKSQHNHYHITHVGDCVWYVKDTNLKANHNVHIRYDALVGLCLICQRYKFKSKSQHCVYHNGYYNTVFDMSKIQI